MDEARSYSVLDYIRTKEKTNFSRIVFFASTIYSSEETLKFFSEYAKQYFADRITGLMLVYHNYTIHLVESTEDEIFRVLSYFVNVEPKYFVTSKYIPMEWNVEQRFFDKWYGRKIVDNGVLAKMSKINCEDFNEVTNVYRTLRNNLYDLCNELREARATSRACLFEKLDRIGISRDPRLPDEKTIGSLLESSWGESLEKLMENYWYEISSREIDDDIWPFPEKQCPQR